MVKLTLDQALAAAEACLEAGQQAEARRILRAVVDAAPGNARALQLQARLGPDAATEATAPSDRVEALAQLCRAGRFEEAIPQAEALLEDHPEAFAPWNLLGGACLRSGRLARAETAFRRAAALMPRHPAPPYNLGLLLQETGRLEEAQAAYETALRLKPDHVEALNNLGNLLQSRGRSAEAVASYRKAVTLRPAYVEAQSNLGAALKELGQHEAAREAWGRALALDPTHAAARAQDLRLRWEECDFTAHADFAPLREDLGIAGARVPPFILLAAEDAPARQRQRSERWAAGLKHPRDTSSTAAPATPRDGRIRLGYFSAHFHDHPGLRLISGLVRDHDPARVEAIGYSYGHARDSALREAFKRNVAQFHEVEPLAPAAIATLAREHGLDIAIDLDGYTRGARPEVLAHRPAPLTVSFLGFPGTSGSGFVDYLVADAVTIPEAERAHYSEALLRLPHSYQPTDDARPRPEPGDTRADHGLPEEGVVFCCFNNSYKIGPREFDIWMRLLRQVPGSVLWLLQSNEAMAGNLGQEAAARGVDPARVVMAPRLPAEAHLARHRHADLFLDTFAYNAHTTASDALWMGLPLVTMAGRQFAARVGASVLGAAGLDELVTRNEASYEALALTLARDPHRLGALRDRLERERATMPLFDTRGYARDFEALLTRAVEQQRAGQPPCDLSLDTRAARS